MSHLFVCFVALVIQGGATTKFWPLTTLSINVWERIGEKHLAQLVGGGRVNLIFSPNAGGAKLWHMSHLFVCFVALVIQGGATKLHHYNQCMGENRRKTLGDVHLMLECELIGTCPIALVIQGVLWPNFGHCTTTIIVWERIGEKHLAQLVGEGACQPDIFTKYSLGCELSYGTCPRLCSPCFSRWCTAKFWH